MAERNLMEPIIEITDTSRLFVTADWHYSHRRICEYCKRPFQSTEEMDAALIKNWNEVVSPGDTVFFLGDFCWPKDKVEWLKGELRGSITFLRGNHDRGSLTKIKVLEIKTPDGMIRMSHDPDKLQYKQSVLADLVAHVHEKWKKRQFPTHSNNPWTQINVGVDVFDFRPASYKQIINCLREE